MISSEGGIFLLTVAAIYLCFFLFREIFPEKLEKHGLSFDGLAIILRTKKLNHYIEHVGKKYSKIWKIYATLGIPLGIILAIYGIYVMHLNAILLLKGAPGAAPTQPLIPGVTVGLDALPYFALAILVTFVPHELSHGFVLTAEDLPIESSGILLFLVIPGGFVEPVEEVFEKAEAVKKLRVLVAGSLTNFLEALAILLVSTLVLVPGGVVIEQTIPNMPAEGVLEPGDILVAINNLQVRNLADLTKVLSKFKPGDKVVLTIIRYKERLNITLRLGQHPQNKSRGIIGAYFTDYYPSDPHGVLYKVFWWSYVVTMSVAVINIMPIYPLDGGKSLKTLLEKIWHGKRADLVTYGISLYLAALILVNIILSLAKWGPRIWYP